mmetsp:Transcript_12281/g.39068  ORF Transcript_12281/g.39068 Transcript_12281/m.39068 type:complete len:272 (+) Transcript_12281:434-1249(+)
MLFNSHAEQIGRNFNHHKLTGIQTSDVARYLIVFLYGGFYADLDMESIKPLNAMLDSSSLILGQEPKAHAFFLYNGRKRLTCNAIIASRHSDTFWIIVLHNLNVVHSGDAVSTTGPLRLDEIVTKFGYDKYVLEPGLFYPLIGPYAREQMSRKCAEYERQQGLGQGSGDRHAMGRFPPSIPRNPLAAQRRQNLQDSGIEEICAERQRHARNHITNDSFTAHHWSHTNLNKVCHRTGGVDLEAMLRSGSWFDSSDPSKRPRVRGAGERITCH